jgi:predicted exporter
VSPFHVPLDDGVALLTFLRGVEDAEAIEASLDGLEGVRYFDQQRFLSDLYGHYRAQATRLVLAGLVVVFALLYLRYRRLRLAFTATAPALLAAGTTLALFSLFGVAINLLHMLGLLLVLSIGVDYGIFLVESRAESQALRASILSILIACASTCLAFGLLALSSFPALAALGATIGVGVLLSLVLAPTALAAVGRGEEDARR